MKALCVTALALVSILITDVLAQPLSITIDQIRENETISGYITGLETSDYSSYKVIVYVQTDQWYIHPYAGQDEGLSWAAIRDDNTWEIETVRRGFSARQIAALLVRRNYPEPSYVGNIQRIPHEAIVVKDLRGTSDFGKL